MRIWTRKSAPIQPRTSRRNSVCLEFTATGEYNIESVPLAASWRAAGYYIVSTSNFIISYSHSRGLVLICMDSKDSESGRIFFKHFSSSTRFAFLCTVLNSNILQHLVKKNCAISSKISQILLFF